MANPELERLTAALRRDPHLREEVRALSGDREALLAWTRDRGYSVPWPELAALLETADELSDEDLEHAAGGEDPWNPNP
jgi:predicted ribosomally synthesized peptide with nif11-like leader